MANETRGHRFRFFRVGGFDQVRLDGADDLLALPTLDQKLWVALACPVQGLEFDQKTLALIDTDKDGRIRAPDILAAVKWATSVLKSPDTLLKSAESLPLSAIDGESEEGKRLLASAKQILANLGKKGVKEISAEDTADTARIFAQTKFNGDGIVPAASADEAEEQKAIEDVVACAGSELDRSGAPGVSQAIVDRFFTEAEAYDGWWKAAESEAARVLPLGDGTEAAAEALRAVKAKVDDYFARVRLAAFDPRAAAPLNRDVAEYAAMAGKELSPEAPELATFPLAHVAADRPLPLREGVNPAWLAAVRKLEAEVVKPLLGERAALTDAEWTELCARFAPFEAWRGAKAGATVEKLGHARVREILAQGMKARIDALIAKDKALEPEANAIDSVDRLCRYTRDLRTLLDNFVSFRDFYSRRKKAIFQAGTLYLDGRSCDLCLQVNDIGAHATLATLSGTFLVYCECTRKGTNEKMNIVAAMTGGDADALMVGRNGIFYDRKGNDWDAAVVKLIEHPISVRQAFWVPYKRVARLIGEQVSKFAAARDKEVADKSSANVAAAATTATTTPAAPAAGAPAPAAPAAPPAPPFDIAKFTGILAAVGLAVGALGSALAMVFTSFLHLPWWQMPLAFAGLLLVVSGPSMLLAWLKLRARNLGPILDANGWAVNARAKMNIRFGASLTAVATLPPNAERSLDDPFEDQKPRWGRWALLGLLLGGCFVAWHLGWAEPVLMKLRPPVAAPAPAPAAK
jgi:hypothetical protein